MGIAERKEREKRQRKAAILEAAQGSFADKGFISTTIDDIAEKAELSKGTIYLYFKGKEDIYASLLVDALVLLTERMQPLVEKENIPSHEMLKTVFLSYFDHYAEHPDLYKMINLIQYQDLRSEVSEETLNKLDEQGKIVFRIVKQVIEKGIEKGELKKLNSWRVTSIIWATVRGISQLDKMRVTVNFSGAGSRDLIVESIDLFMAGIKEEKSTDGS